MFSSSGFKSMEEVEAAFHSMDLDGDGKITQEEMMQFGSLNSQEVKAVFELGDVDRDGSIDLQEFCGVMTSCSPVPYTVSSSLLTVDILVPVLQESGTTITVGDRAVYVVGAGPKCVVWCHDLRGFNSGDRTRQLVDKLAETAGWTVVLPDFIGPRAAEQQGGDEAAWLAAISEWAAVRDFWVEKLWPHLRDELGVRALGVVGTGWGAYIATK